MERNSGRGILRDLSPFSQRDSAVVQAQLRGHRFSPQAVLAVARRCGWGCPQVVLCRPLMGSRPFPTLFWLTCPWLSLRCGQLESLGAVAELERFLASRWGSWRAYQAQYALCRLSLIPWAQRRFLARCRPRFLRTLRLGGVGGIRPGPVATVKCLHLQVGTWLSLGSHPGEDWLRERFQGWLQCPDGRCRALVGPTGLPTG